MALEPRGAPGKQTQGVEDPWAGSRGRSLRLSITVAPFDELRGSILHLPARDLQRQKKKTEKYNLEILCLTKLR